MIFELTAEPEPLTAPWLIPLELAAVLVSHDTWLVVLGAFFLLQRLADWAWHAGLESP